MSVSEKTTKPTKQALLAHVKAEREELVELCSQLRPEEWNKASLCQGWRVRDVVAHLAGSQHELLTYLTAGGGDKANQKVVDKRKARSTEALTAELVSTVQAKWLTKLAPMIFLFDTWVHQQDIRWALGPERQRRQNPERLRILLNLFRGGIEKKKRGVKYKATDLDWEAGEGQLLTGPAEAIIMLLAKRPSALERVEGPGVAVLSERWKNK